MAIARSFKEMWRRIKAVEEEPWFLIAGFMVVLLLALLTVSASSFQPHREGTEPVPESDTASATSQR